MVPPAPTAKTSTGDTPQMPYNRALVGIVSRVQRASCRRMITPRPTAKTSPDGLPHTPDSSSGRLSSRSSVQVGTLGLAGTAKPTFGPPAPLLVQAPNTTAERTAAGFIKRPPKPQPPFLPYP